MTVQTSWDDELDSGGSREEKKKVEFTKFPEGITRFRVLDAGPVTRWTHFIPQAKRSVNCPGQSNGCPICAIMNAAKATGEKTKYSSQKKWSTNILNLETKRVEVCDQGKGFFDDLRDVYLDNREEHGSMLNYDVKAKRKGKGQDDTTYRLDLLEVRELNAEEKAIIEEGRVDLAEYFKPHPAHLLQRVLNGEDINEVMKDLNADPSAPATTEEKEEITVE